MGRIDISSGESLIPFPFTVILGQCFDRSYDCMIYFNDNQYHVSMMCVMIYHMTCTNYYCLYIVHICLNFGRAGCKIRRIKPMKIIASN